MVEFAAVGTARLKCLQSAALHVPVISIPATLAVVIILAL